MADIADEGPIQVTDLEERQGLKQVEDSVLDLGVVFASTLDSVNTLIDNYGTFQRHLEGHSTHIERLEEDSLYLALVEKRRELLLYISKLDVLRLKVQGTSQLVVPIAQAPGIICLPDTQVSSLLDLGNGHSLKTLAEEARVENTTMRTLTEKATADAAAVKVLTIMTLVYLPATVVSVRLIHLLK